MNNPQDLEILEKLLNILDRLNIAYIIGGSMASSVYGAARFTQDADITAEPFDSISAEFYDVVKDDFYISKDAMTEALRNKTSFNVIDLKTAFKIDIFIYKDDAFQKQMFSRERFLQLGNMKKKQPFVSPEDIILLKLDWYKQSGCTSERQLSDINGVVKVQKDSLDYEYLEKWAKKLGLSELFAKAINYE